MDYQEAIETIQYASAFNSENSRLTKALDVAISAMQELQSLHNQGISLERLKDIDFRKEVVEHINYDAYMILMDELEEYRQLGDLEEIREAVQELQIYKENEKRNLSRTDRLMDECAYRHENGNCLKVGGFCTSVPLSHCQKYREWYTEYRGYKEIGTLEEVRDAVGKQKAISREIIEGKYFCPKCHNLMPYPGYCGCGQRLY